MPEHAQLQLGNMNRRRDVRPEARSLAGIRTYSLEGPLRQQVSLWLAPSETCQEFPTDGARLDERQRDLRFTKKQTPKKVVVYLGGGGRMQRMKQRELSGLFSTWAIGLSQHRG